MTMSVFSDVEEIKKMLKEARLVQSLDQLHLIQRLRLKSMFLQKKRVVDITHSLKDIGHNSISEQLTLLEKLL